MRPTKPLKFLLYAVAALALAAAPGRADLVITNYDALGDTYHDMTAAYAQDLSIIRTTLSLTSMTLTFDVFFNNPIAAPSAELVDSLGNSRIEIDTGLRGGGL